MLINTEKANDIFEKYIKDNVIYKNVEIMQALDNNHIKPKKYILNKKEFMNDFKNLTFDELSKKYVKRYGWRTKLAKLFPSKLKETIKKIIS